MEQFEIFAVAPTGPEANPVGFTESLEEAKASVAEQIRDGLWPEGMSVHIQEIESKRVWVETEESATRFEVPVETFELVELEQEFVKIYF